MKRRTYHAQRGQAFVETLLFLPMLLVAFVAIVFFARLGVLSERAESAVRYGDLVSFRNGQAYTTATIGYLVQQAVYHNNPSQLVDLCLAPGVSSAPSGTPTGVNGDIRAALYQTQVVSTSATAAPSPQPFFQPDGITQPACSPGTIDLAGSGPQGSTGQYKSGDMPLSLNTFSITAQVGLNPILAPVILGNTCTMANGSECSQTTANMSFVNVATPTTLLTCVPGLSIVLTVINPAATTTPSCS